MRFSGFYIEGFGLYHRQGVPDLPRGLVLFVGENECGKTTLMEFFRTMLFGWRRRDKRSRYNDYPPLRGGGHGGRLQLVRQDGSSYLVQRLERHFSLARSGEDPLPARSPEELLDGIDRTTYERVFAVGLEDLQGLEILAQEGVGGRLFAAGAGLGSTSVPLALQTLDLEMKGLLLPAGQKQLIPQLLQELTKTETRLQELQGQSEAYAAGQQRREQLQQQLGQYHGEMEELRRRGRRLELRRQAWDPWVHKCHAREEARQRQFARDFPPRGLDRWEGLTQELARLRREQRQWQEEVLRLEQQRRELQPDETLLAQQEAVGNDPRRMRAQQEAVRRLRPLLGRRDLAAVRLQARRGAQQEAATLLQSLARQQEAQQALPPWWPALVLAAAGLAGAAALGRQHFFISAGLVLAAAWSLAGLLWLWRRRQAAAETVRLAHLQAQLQEQEQAQANLAQAVRQLEEDMEAANREIARLAREAGLETPAGPEQLEELAGFLDDAARQWQQWQQQLARLDDKLAAARTELAQRTELEAEKGAARAELLRQADAADEEAFRRLAAAHEEWRGYLRQVEANEIALRRLAGAPETQAALEEELRGTDPLALEAEIEQLQARRQELAEASSRADREYGKLESDLDVLARSREQGEWLLKHRSLREQLAEATRRWAALAVCRHLLEQARGFYERERQPQVIREASRFLEAMAPGRYRLVSTIGEASLQLEDLTLRRKEEQCWSAGLKDQVYLAVRLGLAREFGRRREPLPVILDDVLVKFDPERRKGAARVILDFSREQQVLLFSCHPDLSRLIQEVRQEAPYRDIPAACFRIHDGVITGE